MSSASKVPIIADSVLHSVETRVAQTEGVKTLTDGELLRLHSVFGVTLERALDVLEKHATLLAYRTSDGTRSLVEVKGEADRCYRLFSGINFCPCCAFKRQVVEKRAEITCKHVLAARIASMTHRLTYQEVTRPQYLMLLQSMFHIQHNNLQH